ncbi:MULTISPECIES: hypothetical protein [Aequorivita]|uniref:Uncharacterized protein n=1 Tax=Aequorivita iocasae TaxID=2803865 RepID=A0ABX7DPV3_9FLAO|nr:MULTISPECIES: hypothetical protein [Aequorivita]QQX76170.1 hypothetical protein JK629_12640 [Aequorivita iocasae]UCA55630.1 hypothetical protein LDL78_12695 [Aequorivita sp. F7]
MKTDNIKIGDLHFEHVHWQKELLFWEDEVKSFNNRLTEFSKRWTNKKVLAQLDHFQKQFNDHERVMNSLKCDVDAHETNIATNDERGGDAINTVFTKYHFALRERMEILRKVHANLKTDFFQFLSKYI